MISSLQGSFQYRRVTKAHRCRIQEVSGLHSVRQGMKSLPTDECLAKEVRLAKIDTCRRCHCCPALQTYARAHVLEDSSALWRKRKSENEYMLLVVLHVKNIEQHCRLRVAATKRHCGAIDFRQTRPGKIIGAKM